MIKSYRRFLPYGVAVGTTAIALALSLWLEVTIARTIGAFFYIAVAMSTWYGGLRPGLLAIVLSTLALDYYFMPPVRRLQISDIHDVVRLVLFVVVALILSLLSANLQASERKNAYLSRRLIDENADRLRAALAEAKTSQLLLQQQVEQQHLVMDMSQRIRRSLNLQDILLTAVDEVRQFLQTDRVIVFRFLPDWSGIVAVESCGAEWTAILSTEIHDPCFGENYVESFKQGLVTAKADIYAAGLTECHLNLLAQFQVKANLVVPIIKNGELWGLLITHHCSAPRQWQTAEIDLLRQIAAQLGIALQQSDLLTQAETELKERRQAEENLKRAKAELEDRVAERTAALEAANDRLHQSEARYRAIVEDQTELIVRFAPDSTILFVNDAYCSYFNVNRDDVLGKSYNPIIYEADRETVAQQVRSITPENPLVVIENRVINGRGDLR